MGGLGGPHPGAGRSRQGLRKAGGPGRSDRAGPEFPKHGRLLLLFASGRAGGGDDPHRTPGGRSDPDLFAQWRDAQGNGYGLSAGRPEQVSCHPEPGREGRPGNPEIPGRPGGHPDRNLSRRDHGRMGHRLPGALQDQPEADLHFDQRLRPVRTRERQETV